MIKQRLLALTLLSVFSIGCSESGTPGSATSSSPASPSFSAPPSSDSTSSTNMGINGPHIGEVWIGAVLTGSKRFNLQTGEEVEVSEGLAIPSRDGSVFLEYLRQNSRTVNPDCAPYDQYLDINTAFTRR